MVKLATICYIDNGKEISLLHRNKKPNDIHAGKWIGVGGKLEKVKHRRSARCEKSFEETGLQVNKPVLKGIITFRISRLTMTGTLYVFKVTEFEGRTD